MLLLNNHLYKSVLVDEGKIQLRSLFCKTVPAVCYGYIIFPFIGGLLTRSSFLSSASFPLGCYKLMLWSSGHCQSALFAVKD